MYGFPWGMDMFWLYKRTDAGLGRRGKRGWQWGVIFTKQSKASLIYSFPAEKTGTELDSGFCQNTFIFIKGNVDFQERFAKL